MPDPLLAISHLCLEYHGHHGHFRAIQDVSLTMDRGETLAIVGESGCGKSSLALALMGLLPPAARVTQGVIHFKGRDLLHVPVRELAHIRGNRMAMIFQDPVGSLNPYLTIGEQLHEVFRAHPGASTDDPGDVIEKLFHAAGLVNQDKIMSGYAHELSGGMCQRIMIIMSMLLKPDLLIADEPTTALDVLTQEQVLSLMLSLQKDNDMGLLLITHDLGVVHRTCRRMAVMYAGEIVETGPTFEVLKSPAHPYTRSLLKSLPTLHGPRLKTLESIPGTPPKITGSHQGCHFANRCPSVRPECHQAKTILRHTGPQHMHNCILDPS